MILIAFFVLVALTGVLVWRILKNTAGAPPPVPATEGFVSARAQAELVFLHMDGCGWCVRFMPQWQAFASMYGEQLEGLGVAVVDYESRSPEAAKYKAHVTGYPTVLYVRGSTVVRFEGERTPQGLVAFLAQQGVRVREGFETERVKGGAAVMMDDAKSTVKEGNPSEEERAKMAESTGGNPNASRSGEPKSLNAQMEEKNKREKCKKCVATSCKLDCPNGP